MPFPFTFPFAFDIVVTSSDAGAGAEAVLARLAEAMESGSGGESAVLDKAVVINDGGNGFDTLKALVGTGGPVSDMRLYDRQGQVNIPSKGVKS
jgi:hypothetical protein